MNDDRYQEETFTCLNNEDCNYSCSSGTVGTVYTSVSTCSTCLYGEGESYTSSWCSHQTIICSDGDYQCDIECLEPASCNHGVFNCGDGGSCNITCANQYSCNEAEINCGDGSTCNLYCNGFNSCNNVNFNCGANSDCNIECNAYGQYGDAINNKGYECQSLTVNAADSNSLYIAVYNNLYAAQYMSVYAPNTDNINGSPTFITCGINAYSSLSNQYSCDGIKIYSVEGWNDVQLTAALGPNNMFNDYTDATHRMYCGQNNQYFCYGYKEHIGNELQCHNKITICDNQTITDAPTSNPTESPSNLPSRFPSNNPSVLPSNIPSTVPSDLPTKYPLNEGETASPTNPSGSPTESPLNNGETRSPSKEPTSVIVTETLSPTEMPLGNVDKCDYSYCLMKLLMIIFIINMFA